MDKKYTATFGIVSLLAASVAQAEVVRKDFSADNTMVMVSSNDDWQPANFKNGTAVPAKHVKTTSVVIDGIANESEWADAQEVVVPLSFGTVREASVKAFYTDKEVFLRVRWPDATKNDEHHPWVWDAKQKQYVEGPQVEDSLLISFEAGCEWQPSLLAGYQFDFDGWRWLAARSDPVGQAWDTIGSLSYQNALRRPFDPYKARYDHKTWILKFDNVDMEGGPELADWDELDRRYLLWKPQEDLYYRTELDRIGTIDPTEHLSPPAGPPKDGELTFPQFRPVKLEGAAGEISAKGNWEDGYWTVEFRRILITPDTTMNDTVFNRLTQFSLHAFDSVERVDESSESGRLFLQFQPPETHFANN